MSQFAPPMSHSQSPQGMPFPMPNMSGQGSAAFPFPMPGAPSPQPVQQPPEQMQQYAEQFAEQFATQFAEQFAKQFAQELVQQVVSYLPFAPQVPNGASQKANQAQPMMPPIFAPFTPPVKDAEGQKDAQTQRPAQAQMPMPFVPLAPFAPQIPGASAQPAQVPFPGLPIPQLRNGMPQPQAMQGFPFAMPFSAPAAADAQASDDEKHADGQQGIQTPFGPMPQPHEMHEQVLRGSIDILQRMLAASEAVWGTTSTEGEDDGKSKDANAQEGKGAPFVPPIPGFGFQQIPIPQPPAPGSTVGMMPRSDQFGSLLGALFGASNTEYFYED